MDQGRIVACRWRVLESCAGVRLAAVSEVVLVAGEEGGDVVGGEGDGR